MAVSETQRQRDWLVGPEDGAERLLLQRAHYPAGLAVGLHKHDGEEAHVVLSGAVRFTVDGRQKVCQAGDAAFAPTEAEHGFLALSEAEVLTIREQRLGTLVIAIDPDGTRREVPVIRRGPPWGKAPVSGETPTPNDEVEALYETTRHLL